MVRGHRWIAERYPFWMNVCACSSCVGSGDGKPTLPRWFLTPRNPPSSFGFLGSCVSVRILPSFPPASVGAAAPTLCAAGGGAPLLDKRRAIRVRALRASQARAYPDGSGCAGRAAALRSPRLFGAPPNGSGAPMARPCRLRRRASQLRRAVSRARSRATRGRRAPEIILGHQSRERAPLRAPRRAPKIIFGHRSRERAPASRGCPPLFCMERSKAAAVRQAVQSTRRPRKGGQGVKTSPRGVVFAP